MKVTKGKHHTEISGRDMNGSFLIRIHNDCSQLMIESQNEDSMTFIDINKPELEIIRDTITNILNQN